ncbi:unnamed protein product [Prunus armeniaca]|uniref:DUF7788 domain-containing protein n=1 Tax=Prunus armeniaca TaxID=36596 RepID=A0A6J5XJY0_PRUAR|nr:unnamed protein product [Prunus armeniaca]CAB4311344.1 unnamed protein product [Prunus armeniaca]
MVEDIKQQQIQEGDGLGKFKNSLVVGQLPERFAMGLEILVSEVNEEPWKGKMIKYTSDGKCQLDLIQGHDLKSKFKFTSRYLKSDEGCYRHILNVASNTRQLEKMFDLIVEIGVDENLKAEQMIKKVIVFADDLPPLFSRSFEYEYELLRSLFEAIQSKYEDKGYGDDAVPHILFWNLLHCGEPTWICRRHPGFTLLSGLSTHLYKSFMDNGGELDLHHLMEAVISDKQYQTLTVVD